MQSSRVSSSSASRVIRSGLFTFVKRCDVMIDALLCGKAGAIQAQVKEGFQLNDIMVTSRYDKERPLHVAVRASRPDIVKLLLHLGADPSLKQYVLQFGTCLTPLEYARKILHFSFSVTKMPEIISILENHVKEEADIAELRSTAKRHSSKMKETQEAIRRAEGVIGELKDLEAKAKQRAQEKAKVEDKICFVRDQIFQLELEEDELKLSLEVLEDEEREDARKEVALRKKSDYLPAAELSHRRRVLSRMQQEECTLLGDFVGDVYECVVCLDVPSARSHIHSCVECSNIMCDACADQLDSCPTCRQWFSLKPYTRNRAAEKAVHRIGGGRCVRHKQNAANSTVV